MPSKAAPKKAAAKKAAPKKKAKAPAATKAATATKAPKKAAAKTAAKTAKTAQAPKKAAGKAAAKKAPAKRAGLSEFRNFEPYKPKRGEEYMSDAQEQHFKTILRRWKAELMEEVDRTVTHMKDEAANFPDPADRATQEEEFSLELRTRDRERKLIKKIDATIERIEQRDYGFCDACGVEIGIKRLEARPTATLCIDCKTLDEIKERQELG
jgi:DnaK suppressor protein